MAQKFTWIVVIKIFTINLPSQPFLGRHLGFHIFFHHSLSEGRTRFLQLGCFGLDFISFCICIPQSRPMASFGTFLTYVFFLYYRKTKRWSRCTLNILSVNVQIIYIIHMWSDLRKGVFHTHPICQLWQLITSDWKELLPWNLDSGDFFAAELSTW